MTSKHCSLCGTTKPLTEFNLNGFYCRPCSREKQRQYRRDRPALYRQLDRQRHAAADRRAYHLVRTARCRAAEKGWAFDLTPQWVQERLERGVCEVTGLPFDMPLGDGTGRARAFGPSLDRQDNGRGYTTDNVKVVCWMYNAAKGVSTHSDVVKFAEALCSRQ